MARVTLKRDHPWPKSAEKEDDFEKIIQKVSGRAGPLLSDGSGWVCRGQPEAFTWH